MTPTALNRRALDCAPLDIPLPQWLVTITPIGNSYSEIDRPIWPMYGPGAGYLLRRGFEITKLLPDHKSDQTWPKNAKNVLQKTLSAVVETQQLLHWKSFTPFSMHLFYFHQTILYKVFRAQNWVSRVSKRPPDHKTGQTLPKNIINSPKNFTFC